MQVKEYDFLPNYWLVLVGNIEDGALGEQRSTKEHPEKRIQSKLKYRHIKQCVELQIA